MGFLDDFLGPTGFVPPQFGMQGVTYAPTAESETKARKGAELSAYLEAAVSKVNGTWALTGSSKSAVLGALEADRKRIERLRTGDQAGLELARWDAIAKTTHDDIAAQLGLTDEWSLAGVAAATANATVADVKEGAKSSAPYLIAGAVLVLLIVILK